MENEGHHAYPSNSPPQAKEGKGVGILEEDPTSKHDAAKDSVVPVQCGAVPAVMAELVLALSDPFPGAFAH